MTKVAIVYYSLYGHVATMAKAVQKGLSAAGATADLYQVAETLSEEILGKMHAPPKDPEVPVITDPTTLTEYDGIIFGISGRYGSTSAQLRAFLESTGGLWQKGALVGKPGGVFFSTATQGGGQETIGFTLVQFLTHHGMVFVPLGYTNPAMFNMDEIHGGSPYGPGTYAGATGARQPSEIELNIAESYGTHFAGIATKLAAK